MAGAQIDAKKPSEDAQPTALATSQEIRDRGSNFVAYAYQARFPKEALEIVKHLKYVVHASKPATHEISAWRCMVLKPGKSGLGGPDDFELQSGCDGDGEKWAGAKILRVMESETVIDAVVVVSRWYGGTLLGPARFSHIETCAREVCRIFKRKEEIDECISTLNTLDDLLATLRDEYATLTAQDDPKNISSNGHPSSTGQAKRTTKRPNYESAVEALDIARLKRLITARESAVQSVKMMIAETKGT